MCTLAIYFQASEEFPLIVAANRDEFYDRPSAAPTTVSRSPWVVAGRDLVAGGTWLGVNAHGLAAGILNRRSDRRPDPSLLSRGALCMDALRLPAVDEAVGSICTHSASDYNPFNLLVASPSAAVLVGNLSGTMRQTTLSPGLHVLTNLDLDDMECPRIAKSFGMFESTLRHVRCGDLEGVLADLRTILSDHSTPLDPRTQGPPNNLCVHLDHFGTRSSTIVAYSKRAGAFRMWHADGPPCRTAFDEILLPG